jgi:catalase
MFWRSMTPPEQRHIVHAFAFELSKVEALAVRTRMLGHLAVIERALHDRVATAMGMQGMADEIRPAVAPRDLSPSPALSLLGKAPATLRGRKVGVLIGDGFDAGLVAQLTAAIEKEHASVELVGPRIGGGRAAGGELVPVHHTVGGGPSVMFDAVAVLPGAGGIPELLADPVAIAWVGDAFVHCKVIATIGDAEPLLAAARVSPDAGVIDLGGDGGIGQFVTAARGGRIWSREAAIASPLQQPAAMPPVTPGQPSPRSPKH